MHTRGISLPHIRVSIFDERVREKKDIFKKICHSSQEHVRDDPFVLVCGALQEIYSGWRSDCYTYYSDLQNIDSMIRKLGESFFGTPSNNNREERERGFITQAQEAKELMIELQKLRSYQLHQSKNFECFERTVQECIKEHVAMREILRIPEHIFNCIDKNLRTLLSWTTAGLANLECSRVNTDNSLETLSNFINLRNSDATQVNTQALVRVAEATKKENISIKDITEAAKKDSEAMKTIAIMTMFYLPGSFVAAIFSMGIFNLNDGGSLSISRFWWIYPILTISLTSFTFLLFAIKQRSNKVQEEDSDTN